MTRQKEFCIRGHRLSETRIYVGERRDPRCGTCSRLRERVRWQTPEAKRLDREGRLRRRYGLNEEVYQELLAGQNFRCAICGTADFDNTARRLPAIDHDHSTGKVRGILCSRCNKGLGLFGDSPELMREAITYLLIGK